MILMMNYPFFLLTLLLAINLLACQDSRDACDYPEVAEIVADFEGELRALYGYEDALPDSAYRVYLASINDLSVPRDFLTVPEKVAQVKRLQKSPLFEQLWEKNSVIAARNTEEWDIQIEEPPGGSAPPLERPDFYTLDTDSEFFNCLIDQTQDPELQSFFREAQRIGNLSPGLLAGVLVTMDRFAEESVKTYVALQFYVEFIMIVNSLNRLD